MRLSRGARVVLLRDVQSTPAGTRGVVLRSTRSVVVVKLDNGRTIPVSLEVLGRVQQASQPVTKGDA